MKLTKTVLFKAEDIANKKFELPSGLAIRYWKPGIFNWKPRGKNLKYYLYTLFHFIGVFKNKSFAFIELLDLNSGISLSSLLIVPAHFKYPFMEKHDIQFTYVMTKSEYRGKSFSILLLREAWARRTDKRGMAWYVTNTKNISSIRVAEKAGFTIEGFGKREGGILNRLIKINS